MPDTALPPGGPCQAPSFLWSPPALKQATRAFRLAGDRIAIGAGGSLGASSNKRAGEISLFWEAGPTALSRSAVIFVAPENGRKFSRRLSRLAKYRRLRRQRVAKMYGQQKRNIIHKSSTAYEQDHSAAAPPSSVMNSRRLVCRERSIVRCDRGRVVMVQPPSRPEARRRLGYQTASELGAPVASSIPEQLPGHEPASARMGYEDGHALFLRCRRVEGPLGCGGAA